MNTQEYVKSLFSDYEETVNLKDFMEELQSNLEARIANLVRKGLAEKDAFDKASAELGDISALAKELSLKKRREVFEEAYMDIKNYMNSKRVAAYVILGISALFGIIIAIVGYLAVVGSFQSDWVSGFGFGTEIGLITFSSVLLPFLVVSISGFTFLGLTQETSTHYPMGNKRAAWYSLAAALISLGILIIPIIYFSVQLSETPFGLMSALVVFIPIALPGGGLLAFLVLSEKERFKPWMASIHKNAIENEMKMWNDHFESSRFGMFSGAIWISAIALFILFGFLIGFRYSWLVFLFATAVQLLVQGLMMKKKSQDE